MTEDLTGTEDRVGTLGQRDAATNTESQHQFVGGLGARHKYRYIYSQIKGRKNAMWHDLIYENNFLFWKRMMKHSVKLTVKLPVTQMLENQSVQCDRAWVTKNTPPKQQVGARASFNWTEKVCTKQNEQRLANFRPLITSKLLPHQLSNRVRWVKFD